MKEVEKASNMAAHRLTSTDRLESEILNYVGKYLAQNESNIKNKNYITKLVYRQLSASLKRNRKEHAIHFADIGCEDDSGELIEYDPIDNLAIVDTELLTKETVNLLAKEDGRRKLILNAWANGNTNDTELSETLAGFLGGQSRGHCKFIQRFRIECRGVLTATAV
jgi:hypothetical protein